MHLDTETILKLRSERELLPRIVPAAVATVVPLSAESAATTRAGRRAVAEIITGTDDRLAVIAGPCSIHDPVAAVEYAEFCDRHLPHVDEAMEEYIASPDFDRLLVETVTTTFPPAEHEKFVAHYRGLLAAWVRDQANA